MPASLSRELLPMPQIAADPPSPSSYRLFSGSESKNLNARTTYASASPTVLPATYAAGGIAAGAVLRYNQKENLAADSLQIAQS
jgi:hypothetical protein